MKRERERLIHVFMHKQRDGDCSAGTNDLWDPSLRALEKDRKHI